MICCSYPREILDNVNEVFNFFLHKVLNLPLSMMQLNKIVKHSKIFKSIEGLSRIQKSFDQCFATYVPREISSYAAKFLIIFKLHVNLSKMYFKTVNKVYIMMCAAKILRLFRGLKRLTTT